MFSLFGNKKNTATVSDEIRAWLEENFLWLIETFGTAHFSESLFIIPSESNFPFLDLTDNRQFDGFFLKLCQYAQLDGSSVWLKFFDDSDSMQFYFWASGVEQKHTLSTFYRNPGIGEKQYVIELSTSLLKAPAELTSTLARQLMYVKLIKDGHINSANPELTPLADLAAIFMGFGLVIANAAKPITKIGYHNSPNLNSDETAYALAMLLKATDMHDHAAIPFLNTEVKDSLKQNLKYIQNSNADTLITQKKVSECNLIFNLSAQVEDFRKRFKFHEALEKADEILKIRPADGGTFNVIGYLFLQQKKYKESIDFFNRAIEVYHNYDAAINNRGYAWLQLGFFDEAYSDFESAREINPENAFVWRNLGVYHLMRQNYQEALSFFKEAESLNQQTELIHFFMALVYYKIGDSENAHHYFTRSKTQNEFNDSVLEYPLI